MEIIAHRGASGHEPENTRDAFRTAIMLGADRIEFDVHRSGGRLVVIHDDTLDRTTNGFGLVRSAELNKLRRLDAGNGQQIPLLEEVLDLVDKRLKVNIELKGENTSGLAVNVIDRYVRERDWSYDMFVVSSFDHDELRRVKQLQPKIPRAALIGEFPFSFDEIADIEAGAINVSSDIVSSGMVDEAHRRRMGVFVYTVNEADNIQRMRAMGVDGIFTDFPDRAAQIFPRQLAA